MVGDIDLQTMEERRREDSRFPHTYACDFVRMVAGYGPHGTKLSRSDASRIIGEIASVLDVTHGWLAIRLAEKFKANEDALVEKATMNFLQAREDAQKEFGEGDFNGF